MRRIIASSLLALTFACGDDAPADGDSGSTGASVDDADGTDGSTGAPIPADSTSTGDAVDDTAADSTGEPEPLPEPLVWTDQCFANGWDFSVLHDRLECAGITVPLSWDDPDGETIEVVVFRVASLSPTRKGALWQLDGGPGGSGIGFLFDTSAVDALGDEGWDVMVHAHRGTLIPRLACVGEASSGSCRAELDQAWGEGLQHFNSVAAAHDLAELMTRAAVDDEEGLAIVYGVSYGTYWAQHLLATHPDVADGVVLDSVLGLYDSVETQEPSIDARMKALLDACIDDPVCGPKVGYASGEAFAQAVIDAFDAGDCGPLDEGTWADSNFQDAFGSALNTSVVRNYLPLLAALAARCTPEDSQRVADALDAIYVEVFSAAPGDGTTRQSSAAQRRAAADDAANRYGGITPDAFYAPPVFPVVLGTTMLADDAQIILTDTPLATTGLASSVAQSHPAFADLPNVAFDADFVPEIPVLILNARYDLQTPLNWAQSVAEQYGVAVVEVPDGRHGVFSPGPGGQALDGTPCIRPLVLSFAADPTAPLDDACLATLPQIDPSLSRPDLQPINMAAFGVPDPWTLLP